MEKAAGMVLVGLGMQVGQEDEWGDGEEHNNSGEVSGMGRGGRGKDEAGSAEAVFITGLVEVERDANMKTFSTYLT